MGLGKGLLSTTLASVVSFVSGVVFADGAVQNLRQYFYTRGYDIASLVDGGVSVSTGDNTADIQNGSQYATGFGPEKAFDGVCESTAASDRWLGEISTGTYLKFSLPAGYSCTLDSYKLWRVNVGESWVIQHRAPIEWKLIGETTEGVEVELSHLAGNHELENNVSLGVPVESSDERRFVAFKWIPLKSNSTESPDTFAYSVGLTELEFFVKDIIAPDDVMVFNLRDFVIGEGYAVANYVDGGLADIQTASTLPAQNAFDGLTNGGDSTRWLGEMSQGTYLRFMLPAGYSCDLSSYCLWRLNTGSYAKERTPTKWKLFGITKQGEEVLLSDCSQDSTAVSIDDMVAKDSWVVAVEPAAEPRSFIGFKWVPVSAPGENNNKFSWHVGLMELELFVKNISTPAQTGVWNLRDYMSREGFSTANYADGGVEADVSDVTKDTRVQCLKGCGAANVFDGVFVTTNATARWLGEIGHGAFLSLMLPAGYSCGVDSFRMWRLSVPSGQNLETYNITDRAPTAWTFVGITDEGGEVELSTVTEETRLQEADFMTVAVDSAHAQNHRFIGFTFKPTDSKANPYSGKGYNYTVGLMEFEVLVKDISSPRTQETPVYNLRDYPFADDLTVEISGGSAGTHYPEGYGPDNLHDGLCAVSDVSKRWLGSIANGTYLEYRLPTGYTCEIDSYTMWRLCANDEYYIQRAPTKWTLYGIAKNGTEVPLSSTGDGPNTALHTSDRLTIDVDAQGQRFIGFKWVPTGSDRLGFVNRAGDTDPWPVGLMEFDLLVKNVSNATKGLTLIIR